MAKEIAIREEYFSGSDEATLRAVVNALRAEYLLIELDGYRIEVDEIDYPAVSRTLDELKRNVELNIPR